jgi:hypothetical protein
MSIGIYNMADHYKGDTFEGVRFTLTNSEDSSPIDLTAALIASKFRRLSPTGDVVADLSIGSGITVIDAVNGVFEIDSMVIDWTPTKYYYDVEITFSNAFVKTYIKGIMPVKQDVTYG